MAVLMAPLPADEMVYEKVDLMALMKDKRWGDSSAVVKASL